MKVRKISITNQFIFFIITLFLINEIDSLITDTSSSFGEIASEIEGGRDFSREVKNSATKVGQDATGRKETTEEKVRAMALAVDDAA